MKLLVILLVIALVASIYIFAIALCRVAADADARDEELWQKYMEERSKNE